MKFHAIFGHFHLIFRHLTDTKIGKFNIHSKLFCNYFLLKA